MRYPEKFNSSNLNRTQLQTLLDLANRRKFYDKYLKDKKIQLHTCPGCSYPTLKERGAYEICCVCDWEDDDQDDENADEILGGPNYQLSLTENRLIIGEQLESIAEKVGGKIINNPLPVLSILSKYNWGISELLEGIADDITITDPIIIEWEEKGQDLLRQLITIK